ncbi:MAG: hypothetical protein MUE73_07100 [Planctomycetes bacterium]|nr:hypothetical protein [Planctomycetota bacterium]
MPAPAGGGGEAFLCFLAFAAALVLSPLAGSAGRPLRPSLLCSAGALAAFLPVFALRGEGFRAAVLAGGMLSSFTLLLAGCSAGVARLAGRPAAGVAAAALLGALCLASFHLGDPFLEWGGPGASSKTVLSALHLANPASGAVGRALGIDWLRLSIMYRGFPGHVGSGLSAASFYVYRFPPWWWFPVVFGGGGILLLLAAGLRKAGDPR